MASLKTEYAQIKIASKTNKPSYKQKALRAYTNAQLNQRKQIRNTIRTKHK